MAVWLAESMSYRNARCGYGRKEMSRGYAFVTVLMYFVVAVRNAKGAAIFVRRVRLDMVEGWAPEAMKLEYDRSAALVFCTNWLFGQ